MSEFICIRENYCNGIYWNIGDKIRDDECPNRHFIALDSDAEETVRQIKNEEIDPEAVDLAEKINKKKYRKNVKNGD